MQWEVEEHNEERLRIARIIDRETHAKAACAILVKITASIKCAPVYWPDSKREALDYALDEANEYLAKEASR